MDLVLDIADEYILDGFYASLSPLFPGAVIIDQTLLGNTVPSVYPPPPRDNVYRQIFSLWLITIVFAYLFYFLFATLSYLFVFDHDLMKHPKYLPNQIRKEMILSSEGIPVITLLTIPWFLGEVRGHSRLYDNIQDYGWVYALTSIGFFLFFTDMCIYWIHRWLHHPLIYKRIHKPHHRWIVPTPFSSHAFHPLDGYVQSVPYHLFVFLFPLHKVLYMCLFVFVNMWTILIHDGEYLTSGTFINGAAHHTLHHLYFNYNYGQYFTVWDKIGATHRPPTSEQFDEKLRKDSQLWNKQAREVDEFDDNGKLKSS